MAGAAPEVYAIGLRNPYRFSFDRVDRRRPDRRRRAGGARGDRLDLFRRGTGANFGWACREGKIAVHRAGDALSVLRSRARCEPLFDYVHPGGVAVTGGFVVRDPALTGLVGRYLYADYFAGDIRSLALNFADAGRHEHGSHVPNLSSFGEDANGGLYAVEPRPATRSIT